MPLDLDSRTNRDFKWWSDVTICVSLDIEFESDVVIRESFHLW
jgi:hypothetical protein